MNLDSFSGEFEHFMYSPNSPENESRKMMFHPLHHSLVVGFSENKVANGNKTVIKKVLEQIYSFIQLAFVI